MSDDQKLKHAQSPIKVGLSSCLIGKKVRFDGGHKQDRFITDLLDQFFSFVLVCPEVEVGMGVPRESVHLAGELDAPRMVGTRTETDWTERMNHYAVARVKKADIAQLSGFILKSRSPSCGMERVKLYVKPATTEWKAVGLFAKALMDEHPDLPIEEEGRLNDPALRENFIERLFAYHRLQTLFAQPFKRGAIVRFHEQHKYQLLAHSPSHYRQLGQLVARIKEITPGQFRKEYQSGFMSALKMKATVKKNVNVLQHIAGFLKREISSFEKADLQRAIDDYHQQLVPLIVPLTLLSHFINRHAVEYIQHQTYLNPHPKELMLRNHV